MSVHSMNLAEKVGQLFIASIDGPKINGDIIHFLKNYHIGGIYYTEGNLKNPKQAFHLSDRLQSYSNTNNPLFLAIKQRGSSLNTISKGVTIAPSQRELGHINNRLYTKQMAQIVGKELRAMGINFNVTPHLQLDQNDTCFSDKINHVAKHGRAMIEGYAKNNIIAAAGVLPENSMKIADSNPLYKTALEPFIYAIKHGLQAIIVEDIMEAQSYLREELDYTGLIIMDATTNTADIENNVISAINNGADIILLHETYKSQMKVIDAVLKAVKEGIISEEKIEKAVNRILETKSKDRKSVV